MAAKKPRCFFFQRKKVTEVIFFGVEKVTGRFFGIEKVTGRFFGIEKVTEYIFH